jgi:phosphate transport system protein
MSEHIVSSFDNELRQLRNMIAEMGGYAEKSVVDSVDALIKRDITLAQRVIALDGAIDALQRSVEERAILVIAKRQPMALDLREIVSSIRVSSDLERIGDLGKNIAKRVVALNGQMQPGKIFGGFDHMAEMVLEQLKQVLDAFAKRDVEEALAVWRSDGNIDAMYTSLFRELLTYMMEDPRNIGFCTHLLFCAKNIERIGDLGKNIAKRVVALNGQMQPAKIFGGFDHMADMVLEQLKQVLDAFAQRNVEEALSVWRSDGAIDAMYTSLFRELLTYMMEDPRNIGFCTHLLFCAKNIERIGDHATNIAETVHYLVTGQSPSGERPKNDTTSITAVEYTAPAAQ